MLARPLGANLPPRYDKYLQEANNKNDDSQQKWNFSYLLKI